MAEKKFVRVRDGKTRTRVAQSPKEIVFLRSSGWREVGSFPPPPKAGEGSSTAAWQGWAADEHIDVPEGASRAEIIDAAEHAGALPAE